MLAPNTLRWRLLRREGDSMGDRAQYFVRLSIQLATALAIAAGAVTGTQAGGVPAGQNYAASLSEPSFNEAGQVAFHGTLSGTGVTTSNDRAVWVGGPVGPLALAAREGQAAPGAGGATFT